MSWSKQQLQPRACIGGVERARRAAPEQAVVDEHEVGALGAAARSKSSAMRRDAGDDRAEFRVAPGTCRPLGP